MARTALQPAVSEGAVVTKAALRAAALLGILEQSARTHRRYIGSQRFAHGRRDLHAQA